MHRNFRKMKNNSKTIAENINIYDSKTSLGFGISSKFIDKTRVNIKTNNFKISSKYFIKTIFLFIYF